MSGPSEEDIRYLDNLLIEDEPEGMRFRIVRVLPFGLFDTIIRFEAHPIAADGSSVTEVTAVIAADHRPARAIREALIEGEQPEVEVPGYMVLRSYPSAEAVDTRETVGSGGDFPVDHEEGE